MPPTTPKTQQNEQFDKYSSPKYYFALVATLLLIAVILIVYLSLSRTPTISNSQNQNITSSSNSSQVVLKNSYVASTNYNLSLDLADKSQSIILPDKLQKYSLTQKCQINALQIYKDKYLITSGMFKDGQFLRVANDYEIIIDDNSGLIEKKYFNLDVNTKFTKSDDIESVLKQKAFEMLVNLLKLDNTSCQNIDFSNFKFTIEYANVSSGSELIEGNISDFSYATIFLYQSIDNQKLIRDWKPVASYSFNSKFENVKESYFGYTIPIYDMSKLDEVASTSTIITLDDIKAKAITNSSGYGTPTDITIESYEIINLQNGSQTIPLLQINTKYIPLYYNLIGANQ